MNDVSVVRAGCGGDHGPVSGIAAQARPGPIMCFWCGGGWRERPAFLPMRHLEAEGEWPWACLACVTGNGHLERPPAVPQT
jgi:hypothetical protein